MHMFDVLGKLKEIQENYDNEDMQAAVKAAETQVVEADETVEEEVVEETTNEVVDEAEETVEEDSVEEVHEEDDSDEEVKESEELDRLLKMAGQSGVIGMAKPSVIVSESVEDAQDEVSEEAFVAKEPELEETEVDETEETVEEEAVEETIEVPVSAIAELMKLAGYENYAAEEYANEPEEEFGSVEDQMALAGGLNGPKDMHIAASDGDNAMAINPVKVKEDDKLTFEGMYKRYMEQVAKETLDDQE